MSYYVPIVIEKTGRGERSYDIYSRLLKDRIIMLSGQIDDGVAASIVSQLLFLEAEDPQKDIYFYINSPGGVVTSGLSIYDTMNYIKPDVCTICIGQAASMGAFLLSCGTKGKRFALPHSRVMLHHVSSGMNTSTYADLAISLEQTKKYQDDLFKILAENMNKTVEEIENICNRDHWYIGQEAVDAGIVDKIIDKKK